MDSDEPGLRERKRRATRLAIQVAAMRLATERGFESVTVDEISQQAGVSTRTFFNYFPSKETAIVGDLPSLPSDEAVRAFIDSDGPVLAGVGDLLSVAIARLDVASSSDAPTAGELMRMRRALIVHRPDLFAARMSSMHDFEQELTSVVEQRLAREHSTALGAATERDEKVRMHAEGRDDEALTQRARLIVYIAFAAVRHAWSGWADAGGTGSMGERLSASMTELREIAAEG